MDRRRFVAAAVAGGLTLAGPVAKAQPAARIYRIGFLSSGTADIGEPLLGPLNEGLRDLGFVEGRNFVFDRRYADARLERLPDLAAELARLPVDVIVTGSNIHIAAARSATATIPIVTTNVLDPVGAGFVASLARPGGNITGLSLDASREHLAKQLALLKEIAPGLARVGILRPVGTDSNAAELEAAARRLNVALEVVVIRSLEDFEGGFAAMAGKRVGGVLIVGGTLIFTRRQQIADWALRHRLPTIYALKEGTEAGLLMSYGPNLADLYRRAASYVVKILRGARPADLPVEQPTKFEMVINVKTAKALGLKIPQSLLVRADEVIQ